MTTLFTPEQTELIAQIRRDLTELGYREDLIRAEYTFFRSRGQSNRLGLIDLAAFAQNPPSTRNSCLGFAFPHDASPQAIRPYRDLGAPQVFALHPDEGKARRWKITRDLPDLLGEVPLDRLSDLFRENRGNWNPERIVGLKRSLPVDLPDLDPQLDFIDLDLMPALEADLRRKLGRDIQAILGACRNTFEQWHDGAEFNQVEEAVFALIFRLIAAKMLIDRGYRPDWAGLDAVAVLEQVESFYFRDEASLLPYDDSHVQTAAWNQVRRGLNLQNLSVEALAYVYENTFVDQQKRRDLAIYATPPEIAEYVVRQLPIDTLPEDERTVFEPFTGPAPFLVAALGRLRELTRIRDDGRRHDYFQRMLSGIEADAFAREIGRYSLILADYPNADRWRIDHVTDAYTSPTFDEHLKTSNVVLCNPPFQSFPEGSRSDGAVLFQRDAEALRRVLLHPPKMLGFVLPRPFLTRDEDRPLRFLLADTYQDISVTVLPSRVFSKADVETILLIARRDAETPRYRSAQVERADRVRFLRTGEPTWDWETPALPRTADDVTLWQRPDFRPLWDALALSPSLGQLLETAGRGLRYKTGRRKNCVTNQPSPNSSPGVNGLPEPFLVFHHQYLVRESDQLYRNPDLPWAKPKVIANTFRSSRGLWRVMGAVDTDGLVFSEYCTGLWPREGTPVEVLAAVVSGPIANAFLWDRLTAQDNQIRAIEQIPVPTFTREQTQLIVGLVRAYQSARRLWQLEPARAAAQQARCLELLWQIDAAVLAAYALPPDLERGLLARFKGADRRPPFPFPGYGDGYEQAKRGIQPKPQRTPKTGWKARNERRIDLIHKDSAEGLTPNEQEELERLQEEADRRIRERATLDFEALAELKEAIAQKTTE